MRVHLYQWTTMYVERTYHRCGTLTSPQISKHTLNRFVEILAIGRPHASNLYVRSLMRVLRLPRASGLRRAPWRDQDSRRDESSGQDGP